MPRVRAGQLKRRLRVTVVTSFGTTEGGAEQWLLSMLNSLRDEVIVRVLVLEEGPLIEALTHVGATVRVIPVFGLRPSEMARGARAIAHDLRAHRPDVVVGNGVKAQAALILGARVVRVPNVWVKHDHSFDAQVARPLGWLSGRVVATALEVGEAVGRDDVVVIEPERPQPPLSREQSLTELARFGYRPDALSALVMVGRLVPYKGVDIAISALAYTGADRWRLVVIGSDDDSAPGETERLRQLATTLGVGARVHFCGHVPRAGRLLAAFDALAVMTRPGQAGAPQREGYGITGTEAMLAGVPVIMAGEGPVARRLRTSRGDAGIVVRIGDPLDTAKALAALADERYRQELGQRGCAAAEQMPGTSEVAAAFLGVLADAAMPT